MTKRIININNSFSIYENRHISIWMDPWVNDANEGAWASLLSSHEQTLLAQGKIFSLPDIIYISHLHSDHFDIIFLKEIISRKKNVLFLIKKFKDKKLFTKIKDNIGCKNIVELGEMEWFNYSNLSFFLIPQFHASSAVEATLVNYDLDTSLIIHDEELLLYNEVDNPLTIGDYDQIVELSGVLNLKCKYRVGLLGYSGASDYPQSYLGIDRLAERKKIIRRQAERFKKVYDLLRLNIAIPAGGTYMLTGHLSALNAYKAVPDFLEFLNELDASVNLLDPKVEEISIAEELTVIYRRDNLSRKPDIKRLDGDHINSDNQVVSIESLLSKFTVVENTISQKLKDLYFSLKTEIVFFVYQDFPVYDYIASYEQRPHFEYKLFSNENFNFHKEITLKIHINGNMLIQILSGKKIWNECTYHCVYERAPNIYEPDAMFFLNIYKEKPMETV